jgi:hypothetical protein
MQQNIFKVNSYIYAKSNFYHYNKVFDKFTLDTVIGCVVRLIFNEFSMYMKIKNLDRY